MVGILSQQWESGCSGYAEVLGSCHGLARNGASPYCQENLELSRRVDSILPGQYLLGFGWRSQPMCGLVTSSGILAVAMPGFPSRMFVRCGPDVCAMWIRIAM